MRKWTLLGTAIALEVTGSLSLKGALEAPALYAVVAVAYLSSFLTLFLSLKNGMSLGVGYGIWAASGVALTAVMSLVLFGEPITLTMGVGIAVVMAGVLLVELGSRSADAADEVAR